MLKGLLFNKPATVRSNLKALSATGLQTLQSSTQRGHCLLSASVRPTVGTDGASPGRSSHSYHSKCGDRSEEHTSELQSLRHLACRLLLENKNITRFEPGRAAGLAQLPRHVSRKSHR